MSLQPRDSPARCRLLVQGRARVAIMVLGASMLGAGAGVLDPALAQNGPAAPTSTTPTFDSSQAVPDETTFDSSEVVGEEPRSVADGGRAEPAPVDGAQAAPAAEDEAAADAPDAETAEPPPAAKPKRSRRPRSTPAAERGPVSPADADADPEAGAASFSALPASWTSLAPLSLPTFGIDGFPIPPFLLPIYQAAAAQYGVPWEVLASINEIESDFGRNAGVSSAGAMGWMQFIYSSWERWGTDSDGDRKRDPRNPVDAIFAAARYLRDAGAGTDLPKAIFAYNHAGWYVNKVVERAREFAGLDATLVAALTERALREDTALYRAAGNPFAGAGAITPNAGQALLLTKGQLTRMVLGSKNIQIYPGGRQDIAAGHIDRRVLATLLFLERSGLKPTVTSLFSGHDGARADGDATFGEDPATWGEWIADIERPYAGYRARYATRLAEAQALLAADAPPVEPFALGLAVTAQPEIIEGAPDALGRRLLTDARVELSANARRDIEAGRVDPRLEAVLLRSAQIAPLSVSVFQTGHSYLTVHGTVSNHSFGRAADISVVGGEPVTPDNDAAREMAVAFAGLAAQIRPTEIGSPWKIDDVAYFTDGGHQDHLHVGFDATAGVTQPASPVAVHVAVPAAPVRRTPALAEPSFDTSAGDRGRADEPRFSAGGSR